MKSVKCFECGLISWVDAEFCKRCGASLQESASDQMAPAQHYAGFNGPAVRQSRAGLKKGLAIASLVIGIIGFFSAGILLVGAAVGIIMATVAMSKARRYPDEYGGREFATAGLITNIVSVVSILPIAIIAAIAIPNLLASRRAANEGSAMASMRRIHSAEESYYAQHGRYGLMEDLVADELVAPEYASGPRSGYKFTIDGLSGRRFQVTAIPSEYPMSGSRSFYLDQSGVIRGADKRGGTASSSDPAVDGYYSNSNY